MTTQRQATRKTPAAGFLAAVLLSACTTSRILAPRGTAVLLQDNVHGAAAMSWTQGDDGFLNIEADARAKGCFLKNFLVQSASKPESGQAWQAMPPDSLEGGKARLRFMPASSRQAVKAVYFRTVLVASGTVLEPSQGAPAEGSGTAFAGRRLAGGYGFDHYDFSAHAIGHGGAYARVTQVPAPQSGEGTIGIEWFYDRFSKISFRWAVYATGPCGAAP